MDETMNPLYILGWPLGYVMEWIYKLIPNYGWDIILFTLLITVIKIPLQLNQQKSMARMSAFQPMVAEIQKKYRDKPEKQQEELMKLQEQGYKPTAGCMPMLVNFLVMFGVIEVVYRPLQRIFHIGADAIRPQRVRGRGRGPCVESVGLQQRMRRPYERNQRNQHPQAEHGQRIFAAGFAPYRAHNHTSSGHHSTSCKSVEAFFSLGSSA